jgi:hypothetical protein
VLVLALLLELKLVLLLGLEVALLVELLLKLKLELLLVPVSAGDGCVRCRHFGSLPLCVCAADDQHP